MARNNALSLLLNYDSDSDKDSGYTSEEERKRKNPFSNVKERKAKRSKIDHEEMVLSENESLSFEEISSVKYDQHNNSLVVTEQQSSNQFDRLIPLPEEFLKSSDQVDDSALHGGRIRSFPHERGNWASIIFVPITFGIFTPHLNSLVSSLITTTGKQSLELFQCSEFHISLALTFILRLEWIQPLIQDLRSKISKCKNFSMWLKGLEIFCNEERTRTFLVLNVDHGRKDLKEIAKFASESLKNYNIYSKYEELTFHMSIAWCVGDKMEEMRGILPVMQNICEQYFHMESDMRAFDVQEVQVKTGNRIHSILLSS